MARVIFFPFRGKWSDGKGLRLKFNTVEIALFFLFKKRKGGNQVNAKSQRIHFTALMSPFVPITLVIIIPHVRCKHTKHGAPRVKNENITLFHAVLRLHTYNMHTWKKMELCRRRTGEKTTNDSAAAAAWIEAPRANEPVEGASAWRRRRTVTAHVSVNYTRHFVKCFVFPFCVA